MEDRIKKLQESMHHMHDHLRWMRDIMEEYNFQIRTLEDKVADLENEKVDKKRKKTKRTFTYVKRKPNSNFKNKERLLESIKNRPNNPCPF
jgi:DNA repair exonuclease SbcCD ATPase subunit